MGPLSFEVLSYVFASILKIKKIKEKITNNKLYEIIIKRSCLNKKLERRESHLLNEFRKITLTFIMLNITMILFLLDRKNLKQ